MEKPLNAYIKPYEDEILYSTIARYHLRSGNIDYKDTLEEMFGARSVIPSLEFPAKLDFLSKQLGRNYTSDMLISNHTLLPIYAPFLPIKRKLEIIEDMKYKDGKSIYTKIGITAGGICRKYELYYCPLCAEEEINLHGEAYFHRLHQVQGVHVCIKHRCNLNDYKLTRRTESRISFIRLEEAYLDLKVEYQDDKELLEQLIKISEGVDFILNNDLSSFNQVSVHNKYISLLEKKDLVTLNKRVKQKELYQEFQDYYKQEVLVKVESEIDPISEFNWLKIISRKPKRVVHPIRHILMILFLCSDVYDFFNLDTNVTYAFGQGPWPCLNYVAKHYKENIVNECIITADYKTRAPVGTFKCECGFVYSRKGPDKEADARFKIGRIKEFGVLWENELEKNVKSKSYNLTRLAKIMNCDPKTIVKYSEKLRVKDYIDTSMKSAKRKNNANKKNNSNKKKRYRKIINEFLDSNSKCTKSKLKNSLAREYIWLYKNDVEWLKSITSGCIIEKQVKNNRNHLVDWEERDKNILLLIEKAYVELKHSTTPKRITASLLGKMINKTTLLQQNIDKLPVTKEFIDQATESIEDFQVRRISYAYNELIGSGEHVKRWKLMKKAGLNELCSDRVKRRIEDYVFGYNELS